MTQPGYDEWTRILEGLRYSLDQMDGSTSLRQGFYINGTGETADHKLCEFSHYFFPGLVVELHFNPDGSWECTLPVARGSALRMWPTADGRVQMSFNVKQDEL